MVGTILTFKILIWNNVAQYKNRLCNELVLELCISRVEFWKEALKKNLKEQQKDGRKAKAIYKKNKVRFQLIETDNVSTQTC